MDYSIANMKSSNQANIGMFVRTDVEKRRAAPT